MIEAAKIARFFKLLGSGLFAIVLLLSLMLSLLLFSHSGNQIVINLLKNIEPRFSVVLEQGSVFNTPIYSHLNWKDEQIEIAIERAEYQLDWSCLFNKICIENLNINNINVSFAHRKEQVKTGEVAAMKHFALPFFVDIKQAHLQQLYIADGDLSVHLKDLQLQAILNNKSLTLKTAMDELLVTLPEKKSSNKTNQFPSSLPAIVTTQQLPQIVLPFELYLAPLEISNFTLKQAAQTLLSVNALTTQLNLKQSQLTIQSLQFDSPETDFQLQGKVNLRANYPLSMQINGMIKDTQVTQPFVGQKYQLNSTGDFSKLHSELQLSGLVALQASSDINLLAANLPYKIRTNWQQLQWPFTGNARYLSTNGVLESSGDVTDYQLNLACDYQLENIPNGKLSLAAKGDLQQVNIEQLKLNTLDGTLNLTGNLHWQEAIQWQGELAIENVDLAPLKTAYTGHFSGNIKQQIALKLDPQNSVKWDFSISEMDLHGVFLQRPFAVSGAVSGNDKQGISIDQIRIKNAENEFTVNGQLGEQNSLAVKLNIVDLSHAFVASSGKIDATVTLQGPKDKLQIKTNLDGESLRYQKITLGKLKLNSVATASATPSIALQLFAKQLTVAQQQIDTIELNIKKRKGTDAQLLHQVDLLLSTQVASTKLRFTVAQQMTQWITSLTDAHLELPAHRLTLQHAVDIDLANNTLQLSPHCWQARNKNKENSGNLCVKKFEVGQVGDVSVVLDALALSSLEPFLPKAVKLAGSISATAKLKWQEITKPDFAIKAVAENMLINVAIDKKQKEFAAFPIQKFNVELINKQQTAYISATLLADNLINARLNGQFSLYKTAQDLDLKLNITLPDLSPLTLFVPTLEKLAGRLQTDLKLNGSITNPLINGQIEVSDGAITVVAAPLQINRLNSKIILKNKSATVEGSFYTGQSIEYVQQKISSLPLLDKAIEIVDSSLTTVGKTIKKGKQLVHLDEPIVVEEITGQANIKGQLDWHKKLSGDIHFYADQITINDYDKMDLLISPDIHLSIAKQLKLTGKVLVNSGKITVKALPENAISHSDDIIVIDMVQTKDASSLPVGIDLQVNLGERLKVEALGLNTTIKGELLIRKAFAKELSVYGELNLIDGSYRAFTQQLVLQKSRIVFQGVPKSPYFSIEAIRDPNKTADNVIAGVRVTGTPEKLSLVIFSEPAMSQQDALSYLVRGKSLQASSDKISNNQLIGMLINLGADKSAGVMNEIGTKVGIKDLSLTSSGTGDQQSVGVSGYIAPNIELSYGVGVFDSFSILAIRYEMFERFYIEASSGIAQAIDAYYKFDWD